MKKLYAGCYRIESALTWTAYAHIRKVGRHWHAAIHHATHGDILRPAGAWPTLHEAANECRDILWRDYRAEEAVSASEEAMQAEERESILRQIEADGDGWDIAACRAMTTQELRDMWTDNQSDRAMMSETTYAEFRAAVVKEVHDEMAVASWSIEHADEAVGDVRHHFEAGLSEPNAARRALRERSDRLCGSSQAEG